MTFKAKRPAVHLDLVKPMLAKAWDPSDIAWPEGYVAEEKFDGNRVLLYFEQDGIHIITRGMKDVSAHIPQVSKMPFPRNFVGLVLDAEAFAPVRERRLWHTRSILGGYPQTGVNWQRTNGNIQLRIFDMPRHQSEVTGGQPSGTHTWVARREELEYLINNTPIGELIMVDGVALSQVYESGEYSSLESLYLDVLSEHGEGLILKSVQGQYRPNGRDVAWLKLKPRPTFDWVCMGFTEGKGKYEGQIGALIYGGYIQKSPEPLSDTILVEDRFISVTIGQCSGMTDQVRLDMTSNPQKYLGRVVEIAGQEEMENHVLRHPAFIRIRNDKDPQSCLI